MLKQLTFAAFAIAALCGTTIARELTDDDWAALEEVVTAHEDSMHAKDAGAVIDDFPPAVLPLIAQMTGVEPDVAKQQGIDTMMKAAEGASFDAYDIDYDNADGPYELSDGTTYVLLPTKMVDLPGDGSKLKDEVTVAILLEEQWYLMGFDTAQESQLLIAAYPAFGEPDFVTNFAAALASQSAASDDTSADTSTETADASLTDEQRAALADRIATFDTAMQANDMAGIMAIIPPAMLDKIAAQYGVTTEQAIAATQQAMDEALKTVTFVSFDMDLDNAVVSAQSDGTPYLLIPTETVMDLGEAGGKVKAVSQTLGLLDGDTWYLIRVDDPGQVAIVKELYPGLAEAEFPPGTMEPVTE